MTNCPMMMNGCLGSDQSDQVLQRILPSTRIIAIVRPPMPKLTAVHKAATLTRSREGCFLARHHAAIAANSDSD